jgi:Tfp pilus assembly protein PilF
LNSHISRRDGTLSEFITQQRARSQGCQNSTLGFETKRLRRFSTLALIQCSKSILCAISLLLIFTIAYAQQTKQLIDDGLAAFDRGDIEAARKSFEQALTINQNEVTAHTYLGIIADRTGNLKEAERHFAAAVKSEPNRASVRNNYGAILMRIGRSSLAAVEFEKSLQLDPNQVNALTNLAQIRFAGGKPDDLPASAELFKRALAIRQDVEIARALTVISLKLKDYQAAATYYQNYSTESGAQTPAARAELGAALFEGGLLKEAETELTAAINSDPTDTGSVLKLARVYLANKDITAAGRTLETSVARGNDPAPIYSLLAEVYEQSGHVENAIPALRLAIERDPQSEKYRFDYAILLTNSNAPAAAVIRLEEALKSFPSGSRLWFALGFANFKLDKNEEAERALRKAVELDPKFAPALAYLGLLRARIGAYNEAITLYESALRSDPKLAVTHHLIADAILKMNGDASVIEKHLRQSIELDPTFTPARLALGKLFMRSQRWAEAVVELEKVIKLDPNLNEAYYQLGLAYGRLKRPADAQATMATFKRLSDEEKKRDSDELHEVVKRLSNVRF